jgi:hypothetical protein
MSEPYATSFNPTGTPTFPTIQGVTNISGSATFWEHEIGLDQVAERCYNTHTSIC